MPNLKFLYGLAIFLVALGILLINDRRERRRSAKPSGSPPSPGTALAHNYDSWKSVAFLVVGVAVISLAFAFLPPEVLRAALTIPIVVVGGLFLLLAWYSRGRFVILWHRIRVLFGAESPLRISTDKDGQMTMNCPKCGATVRVAEIQSGSRAFQCDTCGETADWG